MAARLQASAEYQGVLPYAPQVRLALENGLWLLHRCDSMAARVRELEAERDAAKRALFEVALTEAALRERAQEVRRAWDAVHPDARDVRHERLRAAIDALCPPSDTPADASRAPGAGEETR